METRCFTTSSVMKQFFHFRHDRLGVTKRALLQQRGPYCAKQLAQSCEAAVLPHIRIFLRSGWACCRSCIGKWQVGSVAVLQAA